MRKKPITKRNPKKIATARKVKLAGEVMDAIREVDAFFKKNPKAEVVADLMAQLLRYGIAHSMEESYDAADAIMALRHRSKGRRKRK